MSTEPLDRVVALEVLVAVPPQLELSDLRLGEVGGLLEVELDDAGADVGAADIDGEDGVVRLEDPGRREMHRADQAGLVGIVADRLELDLDAFPP